MPTQFRYLPLLSLALSLPALAADFGDINIFSRIGEPLQAEVRLLSKAEEGLSSACFSVLQSPTGDLPSITDARIHVESRSGQTFLRITGRQPLHEPLANLRLRAGCGFELQRDYVVMPSPPPAIQSPPPSPPIARVISNAPQFVATAPPVPRPRSKVKAENPENRSNSTAKSVARPAVEPLPEPAPLAPERLKTEDRLVLAAAPAFEDARFNSPEHQDIESRMLRMETSLRHLNQALDSIDAAMALHAESQALRHELQLTQSLQAMPAPAAASTTTKSANGGWQRWIQLFLGMLLGGGLTALLIDWLDKRQPRNRRSLRLSA